MFLYCIFKTKIVSLIKLLPTINHYGRLTYCYLQTDANLVRLSDCLGKSYRYVCTRSQHACLRKRPGH